MAGASSPEASEGPTPRRRVDVHRAFQRPVLLLTPSRLENETAGNERARIDLRVARRQRSAAPRSRDSIDEATEPHDGVVQRIDDLGESPQGGQDRNEFIDARRQLLRVGVDALRRRTQAGYLLGDLARV